jgi:hypothetical protein
MLLVLPPPTPTPERPTKWGIRAGRIGRIRIVGSVVTSSVPDVIGSNSILIATGDPGGL